MSADHPYDWAVIGPPFGIWTTALGSAGQLMAETLTLNTDGSGTLVTTSALRGEELGQLVWRHRSPGQLDIVLFQQGESASSISQDMWESIIYRSDWLTSDTGGSTPVLRNRRRDGFWTLSGPVQLVGRAG